MKKYLYFIFVANSFIILYSDEIKMEKFIETGVYKPLMFDARKFYSEKYFSEIEAEEYIELQDQYFDKLEKINDFDLETIKKMNGSWSLFLTKNKNLYNFIDYKSAYELIGFLNDSYYGFAVNFWGDGTFPLYKNQDYLVSTVGTMGWIGPILRYEFQNEKMYLYILNMDKWELADFHEGGKNYFIKTNPTHTPLTP